MLAVIGGSGFLGLGKTIEKLDIVTPYGLASVNKVKILDEELYFLPRHGETHSIPPHMINYKANISALRKLGVSAVFATYASGIISKYKPGDLVLLEDFIGLDTPITFYDDFSSGIKHMDFTEPFDRRLKLRVLEIADSEKIKIKEGGIIVTTCGPRFETRAEIAALKKMGANLVNMTCGYEATLIREAEIPFAALAIGTNYACGISKKKLSHEEVTTGMEKAKGKIDGIIGGLLELVS